MIFDYSVNILETIYHEIFRWIIIILDFFKYSSIYDEKIYDSIYIYKTDTPFDSLNYHKIFVFKFFMQQFSIHH